MNKNKFEIVYSILIIITVPALIVANTVFLGQQTRDDFDLELQRKADLVNISVASASKQFIANQDSAQDNLNNYLKDLSSQSPTLYEAFVVNPNLDVVASNKDAFSTSDSQEKLIGSAISRCQILIKNVNQNQQINFDDNFQCSAIAQKSKAFDKEGKATNIWEVATPIIDEKYEIAAVSVSSVTSADAEELLNNTFLRSYIFLAISVVIVIVLLIHHFKLAGYSRLLAKQKEINQAMSDFLSVATHELKAPTSIIKGYISNVTDGMFGDISKDVKAQLYVALNQTDRLNNLVQDLLNVSRVEQGRIKYDIQKVNTVEIINTITSNYQQRAKDKGLELTYNQENVANIKADAGRVQEIFTNLIDNAVKYTPSGSVTINHSIEKNMLVTKIRDTGFGISAENRKRLFQRFYRVQTDDTKDISGTGLGLWIIKQYIEAMGGRIEVDSLVGSGTEFTVHLPIDEE